jgi:hypothetical protein
MILLIWVAREEFFKGESFFRCLGMKRKSCPTNFDVIILSQLLNTHGTEIAPRSNIIGEYLQNHRLIHMLFLFALTQ